MCRTIEIFIVNPWIFNQVTCLDIGTGTGILLLVAAHLGIKHLVGIDIEEYAANQARINCENNHVSAEIIVVIWIVISMVLPN